MTVARLRHHAPLLACLLAGATLAGAFAFQHLGGLAPCPICIWQRWPYAIGVLLLLPCLRLDGAPLAVWLQRAAMAVFLVGAGLGGWHAGIEYGFWPGPASCGSGAGLQGLRGEALLAALEQKPMVRCDVPQWSLAGITLAGWSALVQLLLVGLLAGARRAA